MTIFDMLEQSGVLTLLGMGVVFGFLVILVICVSVMGKIIRSITGDKGADAPSAGASGPARSPAKTTAVAAAITAAVSEYRKNV